MFFPLFSIDNTGSATGVHPQRSSLTNKVSDCPLVVLLSPLDRQSENQFAVVFQFLDVQYEMVDYVKTLLIHSMLGHRHDLSLIHI